MKFLVGLLLCVCMAQAVLGSFENTNVLRTVDLTTSVARVGLEIKAKNTGSSSASTYLVAVEASMAPHLAFIDAFTPNDDVLSVSPTSGPASAPQYATPPHTRSHNSLTQLTHTHTTLQPNTKHQATKHQTTTNKNQLVHYP